MSRAARIIEALEGSAAVTPDELAETLSVSRRTLVAEIATLQEALGRAATITLAEGRYRLLVADPEGYQEARAELLEGPDSFNDPQVRASYLVARLFRALGPVRIEDLASGMNVGRTTVVADLAQARDLVGRAELEIVGRQKVGLALVGPELQQRLHILRHHYRFAYPADATEAQVSSIVHQVAGAADLAEPATDELTKWAVVAVDRARRASCLDEAPARYSGLVGTAAHGLAQQLLDRLGPELGVEFTDDEAIFLALPILGMRAPEDGIVASQFSDATTAEALVESMLEAVNTEMEIDLGGSDFLTEFARHVAYMLNRMRYRVWVDDFGVSNIHEEFPVAYRMATVAAQVMERQVGLPVEASEVSFLAAYFQLFLASRETPSRAPLHVLVLASAGRVGSELVRLQLSKLLPLGTRFQVMPQSEIGADELATADLVVHTGDEPLDVDVPVLRVTRVLDRRALARQLERLQLRLPGQHGGAPGGSVLARVLDEAHFFALPADTEYADAVEFMTGHLEARGLVEAGFGERVRRREEQAQMQLDPWVGFPHVTLEGPDPVMLAIGVVPRRFSEDGVRLIVLLGVPADSELSEAILVQVYDEVLRLGARRDLLDQLCRVTSYEQFYYFFEHNPLTER